MSRRGENIYKRKDGRYEGRYIKGYDSLGKARYGYVYARNYCEVKTKLMQCKINMQNQQQLCHSNITVSHWFQLWLLSLENQVKPSTYGVYMGYIHNHILPDLGNMKLIKLNSKTIQDFINRKLNLGLSVKTVRLIFAMMKTALREAQNRKLINDVYSSIKLPKLEHKSIRILSRKEQKRIEKEIAISKNLNDIGILISLYTGMRIGELCALKWEDIDFEKNTVRIERSIQRIANLNKNDSHKTKVIFSTPKSIASCREIPLPQFLMDKLKSYKKENGFVLHNKEKFIEPRIYRYYFKSILKKAKIADVKFHALRHTFATRALEMGFDAKTLSEILGHSSATITLNQYAHSLQEHKKREMERLGELYVSSSI